MPHENKRALQALIADPSNWMMGEMPGGPKNIVSALGRGQALPTARDAIEMIKRLQGGVSRVPTTAARTSTLPTIARSSGMQQPDPLQKFLAAGERLEDLSPWRGLQNIKGLVGF